MYITNTVVHATITLLQFLVLLLSHNMFRQHPAIIRCIFLLRGCYTARNLKFV
jgi:hypothetical protein